MNIVSTSLSEAHGSIEAADVFICSASFEDRSTSIPLAVAKENFERTIVAHNQAYSEHVESSRQVLLSHFGSNAVDLELNSNAPLLSADNLFRVVSEQCQQAQRIVIDASTFTHETLLMLIKVCSVLLSETATIEFLYTRASEYSVGDNANDAWLSKGVREIRTVLGFTGSPSPMQSTHLILLAGFESFRALSLIRELEPKMISIGHGSKEESATESHHDTNLTSVRRIRSMFEAVDTFEIACYCPESAMKTIETLISENESYNTVIAPMNTKLSTIAAGFCALRNESVQLCYAQPEYYNFERYSAAAADFFRFSVDSAALKATLLR